MSSLRSLPAIPALRWALGLGWALGLRWALWLALLVGLHRLAARQADLAALSVPPLEEIQRHLPTAARLGQAQGQPPLWEVLDREGQSLAWAAMTSPAADRISGYAGPSNVLILLNDGSQVSAVSLLTSHDTQDHVARVRHEDAFWQQFIGRTAGPPQPPARLDAARVDGVSGATLTSLAIAESIQLRLSGSRLSLRFPDAVTLAETQLLYPEAHQLVALPQPPGAWQVLDAQGALLGQLWRTGALVDDVIGYQGPSELLCAVDAQQIVRRVRLRKSFDTQPYVRYTTLEASFWARFVDRSLHDLAMMDLEAEGIEGVSGATMTSMAVAESLRRAAQRYLAQQQTLPAQWVAHRWNWSVGEVACLLVALAVVPWSLSRWRGRSVYRRLWQGLMLLVVVGWSGNLISVALLAGWTRSLPALHLAPGLLSLVMVSLLMPALAGRNVYCDHVCPHGIAQQWLARWPRGRRARVKPPGGLTALPIIDSTDIGRDEKAAGGGDRRVMQPVARRRPVMASSLANQWLDRVLHLSALLILIMSVTWLVWRVPGELTIFEPFDVYAWRVGWSASWLVWCLSLFLALRKPMGYCRLACPTGKVLEGIRRKRTSWQVHWSDILWLLAVPVVWLV